MPAMHDADRDERMRSGPRPPPTASVCDDPRFAGERPRPRPSRGRSDGKRPAPATAGGGYFPPPAPATRPTSDPRLCIAKQNSRRPPSSAALRPPCGAGPVRPPSGDRREGRDGRGRSDKEHHHDDRSRRPRLRPAARVIADRPSPHRTRSSMAIARSRTSPTRRPLPEANAIGGAVADIFDALIATLARHAPRTRPRRPALVDGQPVPPRRRPRATRARRQ